MLYLYLTVLYLTRSLHTWMLCTSQYLASRLIQSHPLTFIFTVIGAVLISLFATTACLHMYGKPCWLMAKSYAAGECVSFAVIMERDARAVVAARAVTAADAGRGRGGGGGGGGGGEARSAEPTSTPSVIYTDIYTICQESAIRTGNSYISGRSCQLRDCCHVLVVPPDMYGHFCNLVKWPTSWWPSQPYRIVFDYSWLFYTVLSSGYSAIHVVLKLLVWIGKRLLLWLVLYSTLLYSTLLSSPLLYCTVLYSTRCTLLSSTVLCYAMLHWLLPHCVCVLPCHIPCLCHSDVCVTPHNARRVLLYVDLVWKPSLSLFM